jgi:tetratricopeptide (TPR) repeat protein
MTKPQAERTKAITKRAPRRKKDTIVVLEPEPSGALGTVQYATDWRFHLASLARISDNLVSRAVDAYDRIFGLDDREEGEIYFEVAKKLVDEERLDEAIAALRKVLRTTPNHGRALYELGVLHFRQGAPLAAITMLEQAKGAGISDRKLHMLLADAFCREERFEEALKEFDLAVSSQPDVAATHYRRGLLLDRLERHAEAITAFEKAIRLAPQEIRYHQSLGFTLETMGRRTDAIRSFKRALEVERTRELHDERDEDD